MLISFDSIWFFWVSFQQTETSHRQTWCKKMSSFYVSIEGHLNYEWFLLPPQGDSCEGKILCSWRALTRAWGASVAVMSSETDLTCRQQSYSLQTSPSWHGTVLDGLKWAFRLWLLGWLSRRIYSVCANLKANLLRHCSLCPGLMRTLLLTGVHRNPQHSTLFPSGLPLPLTTRNECSFTRLRSFGVWNEDLKFSGLHCCLLDCSV